MLDQLACKREKEKEREEEEEKVKVKVTLLSELTTHQFFTNEFTKNIRNISVRCNFVSVNFVNR